MLLVSYFSYNSYRPQPRDISIFCAWADSGSGEAVWHQCECASTHIIHQLVCDVDSNVHTCTCRWACTHYIEYMSHINIHVHVSCITGAISRLNHLEMISISTTTYF